MTIAESSILEDHDVPEFYWVWIDPSSRYHPNLPPELVVASPWRDTEGRLSWEGCGTDEGVHVVEIVAKIDRPADLAAPSTPRRRWPAL